MTQDTSGIKAPLSRPTIYDFVQDLLGARAARAEISAVFLRARPGQMVLDVGCGTGELLPHLPTGVGYFGVDLSQAYIDAARARYGARGRFECLDVNDLAAVDLPTLDAVIAVGLLHHLDDAECTRLLRRLWDLLSPGGRIITVDPTLEDGQHPLARFLAMRDRGRNVRSPLGYEAIAKTADGDLVRTVRHDLLRVPYSHCILELSKAKHHDSVQ